MDEFMPASKSDAVDGKRGTCALVVCGWWSESQKRVGCWSGEPIGQDALRLSAFTSFAASEGSCACPTVLSWTQLPAFALYACPCDALSLVARDIALHDCWSPDVVPLRPCVESSPEPLLKTVPSSTRVIGALVAASSPWGCLRRAAPLHYPLLHQHSSCWASSNDCVGMILLPMLHYKTYPYCSLTKSKLCCLPIIKPLTLLS
ncbi:hypothetical protein NP233_g11171 [Leucocoprinus birnbaumii]|uniref:Uncharacterized protein n=1 Tax=Leucocoprinus birnbaumii TaxID=56174 RepID=A0AAD5YP72_9AGAR|nr:hypothetical protein NP233_g11171 [Leucocoprinus birnbaumii]